MRRRPLRALALAAAAVLLTAGTAPALAGTAGAHDGAVVSAERTPDAGVPVDTGRTCAVEAAPLLPGQDPAALPPVEEVCFDTLAEALEHVTGRPVDAARLADADRGEVAGLVADGVAARSASSAASTLLGVAWRDPGYGGRNTVFSGSGSQGCWQGATYGFPNLATYGQNNVVSSADSYGGCWSTYYDGSGYAGVRRTCAPTCSSMGSMDDRASSIVFRPRGTLG